MVERSVNLDKIFNALADHTRRDILKRVAEAELSISEIALPYKLTFAAVSKHLMVLQDANLIVKRRQGKQQMVRLKPGAFANAYAYLRFYEQQEERLDALEQLLSEKEH